MALNQTGRIEQGWSVVGSDDSKIGKIVEVHDNYLLVESGLLTKHNLYVPVSAVTGAGDGRVAVDVPAGDADQMGWRFPPERSYTGPDGGTGQAADGTTTMTGAAFGAGAGVSSAGPVAPGHGDAIADRLGGSGRAGLSAMDRRSDDPLEPTASDEFAGAGATGADDDDDDDTSDDTSEGTSEDTSEEEIAPLT